VAGALSNKLPRHIAIIMDGNGRWAEQRNLPRAAGHQAGLESAREIIEVCSKQGIEILSLFAFSSENWQRPEQEVDFLMDLLFEALEKDVQQLHKNYICLKFIGDRADFSAKMQLRMEAAEELTSGNPGLKLIIALNYGGRWDILQAAKKIAKQAKIGQLEIEAIDQAVFAKALCLADFPDPDLFIRPSGEQRVSNFFLWQLAYSELFFSAVYWPDFREQALLEALDFYTGRQRRFGLTSKQLDKKNNV